jgi:hypothetical protein
MDGSTVSSILERVLERLKGAASVEEHLVSVNDHMHTCALSLRLPDGTQAYVQLKWVRDEARDCCSMAYAEIFFETGEVYELTGGDAGMFERKLWRVVDSYV